MLDQQLLHCTIWMLSLHLGVDMQLAKSCLPKMVSEAISEDLELNS